MSLLTFAVVSFVAKDLIDDKVDSANAEITRARTVVEEQVKATGTSSSTASRMNAVRIALTNQTNSGTSGKASFTPVLVVNNPDGSTITSPERYKIPAKLRDFVGQGVVAYQFAEVTESDGARYKALIIGSPTKTDIPNLQIYLVMSMQNEEDTLSLMKSLFSMSALILIVLLVGITWLLTRQVITPVRSASRIAERFADGHLRERMIVDGEDEMARLGMSFNSMAESISKQIRQLEEYGDLQRQFTSDVSHELRTPLTTVRMAADLIEADSDNLSPASRRASELMNTELDRFEMLLTDLLEISRHDAGVADLAETPLDMRACVTAAITQVEHLAEELGVELVREEPQHPVNFVGDSRRIERVLRNLLANAIDHAERKPVIITVAENDEAVAVTVVDHGVGLKPGQESLVFNRFWRADPSRVRHSGGTGLGLAISLKDATLHGGVLDAIGSPGVGTMFRLVLPKNPRTPMAHYPLPLQVPEPLVTKNSAHDRIAEPDTNHGSAIAVLPPEEDTFSGRVLTAEDTIDEEELNNFYDPDFEPLEEPSHLDVDEKNSTEEK